MLDMALRLLCALLARPCTDFRHMPSFALERVLPVARIAGLSHPTLLIDQGRALQALFTCR